MVKLQHAVSICFSNLYYLFLLYEMQNSPDSTMWLWKYAYKYQNDKIWQETKLPLYHKKNQGKSNRATSMGVGGGYKVLLDPHGWMGVYTSQSAYAYFTRGWVGG